MATPIPLKIPPGVYRPGTEYEAKGRWYDASLVRWHEKRMGAIGGWRPVQVIDGVGTIDLDLTEQARGIHAWRSNAQAPNLAFGTTGLAWQYANGAVTDITPVGFVTGNEDAIVVFGNYGQGVYGLGAYGEGISISGQVLEAQNWSFDAYGQNLVACAYSDGRILMWDPEGVDPLVPLANAPTDCLGVVVTPERFIVALGAGGDARMVQWPDQLDPTDWTPSPTNQAGDFALIGSGQIMAGRRGSNETLIWTDVDIYVMRYIGGLLVYRIDQRGSSCGLISRRGAGVVGGRAFWMSNNGFYEYDGAVKPIECDVQDLVFRNINRVQRSKVACEIRATFQEVTWYYPSAGSVENDRYVTHNWLTRVWSCGELPRTAAIDAGVISLPVAVAPNGLVYEHEIGDEYPDWQGGADLVPFALSGPVELGNGDRKMHVREIIPDANTLGGVNVLFLTKRFPTSTPTEYGPFALTSKTNVRFSARQVQLRVELDAGASWGVPKLGVVPGGRR